MMLETQDVVPAPYADTAWTYRKAGWLGVIPTGNRPAQKSPPPTGYTGWCGKDPSGADVQAWIDGPEGTRNIALHLPPGVYVLDVDVYGDKDGAANLPALPATWTNTARGQGSRSRQYFYRATLPEGRMWADHPVPGTESLHTGHRYAVVWPSVNPHAAGALYHWYDPTGELYEGAPKPAELTELPAELVEAFSKPGVPLEGFATSTDEAHGILQLFRDAPPCQRVTTLLHRELDRLASPETGRSIHDPGKLHPLVCYGPEGHAGVREALSAHHDAYVSARVRERSESAGFASADWWRQVRGSLGKKLAANGGEVLSTCDCAPELGELVDDPAPGDTDGVAPATDTASQADKVDALLAEMLTAEQVAERPAPQPLIKGLLNLDSESWIIGEPGSKKSFVALDMAAHVARGMNWQNLRTARGRAVMIIAEGAAGASKRVRAWEKRHGPIGPDLLILPRPVQAKNAGAWSVLVEACRRLQPTLVVMDTQARVTVGLEENSATEMGVYVEAVRAIRQATGACVLTVHHTGRNGGDARGSSALDGAQDTELKVIRDKNAPLRGELHTEKQKDLEERDPLTLTFERVELELDEDGDQLSSLVLTNDPYLSASMVQPDEPEEWERGHGPAIVQLFKVLRDQGGSIGLTQAQTRSIMVDRFYGKDSKKLNRSTFHTAWTRAREKHSASGDPVMVNVTGEKWIVDTEALGELEPGTFRGNQNGR